MSLTASQTMAVRRHAGYPATPVTDDVVEAALAGLTAEGETVLTTLFLVWCDKLELAVINSSDALDTAKAAVWERNANELLERSMLYRGRQLALCAFLGVPAGPGIAAGLVIPPIDGAGCPPDCSGGETAGPPTGEDALYEPVVFIV